MITLTIDGPQGSGKTTLACVIAKLLQDNGHAAYVEDVDGTLSQQDIADRAKASDGTMKLNVQINIIHH